MKIKTLLSVLLSFLILILYANNVFSQASNYTYSINFENKTYNIPSNDWIYPTQDRTDWGCTMNADVLRFRIIEVTDTYYEVEIGKKDGTAFRSNNEVFIAADIDFYCPSSINSTDISAGTYNETFKINSNWFGSGSSYPTIVCTGAYDNNNNIHLYLVGYLILKRTEIIETCDEPIRLTVDYAYETEAKLNWRGTSGADYTIQYRKIGASSWSTVTATTSSITITGLLSGTTYEWKVMTECSNGASSGYVYGNDFTTQSQQITPNTPTGISASAQSTSSIYIGWNNSANANSYKIYQNGSYLTSTSNTYYTKSGLSANTNYCYKIKACNGSDCSGYSTEVCAKTPQNVTDITFSGSVSPTNGTQNSTNFDWNVTTNGGDGSAISAFVLITNPITGAENEFVMDFVLGTNPPQFTYSKTLVDYGTYKYRFKAVQSGKTYYSGLTSQPVVKKQETPCPTPTASFTANKYSGTKPLYVNFTDKSSAGSGYSINSRSWNFKDGSTSTATNPSHTFNSSGNYNVTLTVTNSCGNSNSYSDYINVSNPVPQLIVNGYAPNPNNGEQEITDFQFKTSVSGGNGTAISCYVEFIKPDGTTVDYKKFPMVKSGDKYSHTKKMTNSGTYKLRYVAVQGSTVKRSSEYSFTVSPLQLVISSMDIKSTYLHGESAYFKVGVTNNSIGTWNGEILMELHGGGKWLAHWKKKTVSLSNGQTEYLEYSVNDILQGDEISKDITNYQIRIRYITSGFTPSPYPDVKENGYANPKPFNVIQPTWGLDIAENSANRIHYNDPRYDKKNGNDAVVINKLLVFHNGNGNEISVQYIPTGNQNIFIRVYDYNEREISKFWCNSNSSIHKKTYSNIPNRDGYDLHIKFYKSDNKNAFLGEYWVYGITNTEYIEAKNRFEDNFISIDLALKDLAESLGRKMFLGEFDEDYSPKIETSEYIPAQSGENNMTKSYLTHNSGFELNKARKYFEQDELSKIKYIVVEPKVPVWLFEKGSNASKLFLKHSEFKDCIATAVYDVALRNKDFIINEMENIDFNVPKSFKSDIGIIPSNGIGWNFGITGKLGLADARVRGKVKFSIVKKKSFWYNNNGKIFYSLLEDIELTVVYVSDVWDGNYFKHEVKGGNLGWINKQAKASLSFAIMQMGFGKTGGSNLAGQVGKIKLEFIKDNININGSDRYDSQSKKMVDLDFELWSKVSITANSVDKKDNRKSLNTESTNAILSGAKIYLKRNNEYIYFGCTDKRGKFDIHYFPSLLLADTFKIEANGYENMNFVLNSASNNEIIISMLSSERTKKIHHEYIDIINNSYIQNINPIPIKVGGNNIEKVLVWNDTTYVEHELGIINYQLNEIGLNEVTVLLVGYNDTIQIEKNVYYYPPEMVTDSTYQLSIKNDKNIKGIDILINGEFIQYLTNSTENIALPNGRHIVTFAALGYRDTTFVVDNENKTIDFEISKRIYPEKSELLTMDFAQDGIWFVENMTIRKTNNFNNSLLVKRFYQNEYPLGFKAASETFSFYNTNQQNGEFDLALALNPGSYISNENAFLAGISEDYQEIIKIPIENWSDSIAFSDVSQVLSFGEYALPANTSYSFAFMKRQAPTKMLTTTIQIAENETEVSVPLPEFFADPDSIKNDMTYELGEFNKFQLKSVEIKDGNVIIKPRNYIGPTSFTLKCTHDGLTVEETFDVNTLSVMSIDELSLAGISNVKVYPNPNSGLFTLEMNIDKLQNLNVELISTTGKIIFNEALDNKIGNYRKELDISHYAKGIYFLNLSNGNQTATYKVIMR